VTGELFLVVADTTNLITDLCVEGVFLKGLVRARSRRLICSTRGEDGFKDRDLYVWCANASDGIVTAQPYMNRGKQLRDIKGKHGAPFGETIMQKATEGTIKETTYWWPLSISCPTEVTRMTHLDRASLEAGI
jgi:hypothetical protein